MKPTRPMTAAQQKQVCELLPIIERAVRKITADDEYQSLAMLSLCEHVMSYYPDAKCGIRQYCIVGVRNDVLTAMKRDRRMITGTSVNGRHCSGDDGDENNATSLNDKVPFDHRDITPLSHVLPEGLREIAILRFVEKMSPRGISQRTRITERRVLEMIEECITLLEDAARGSRALSLA
jgi:DNA-directed RNA polymerase specialized sigma24 family protein